MDISAYIESGILELYVAGVLSVEQNKEVYDLIQKHPEIHQEVLKIEAAIVKLTSAAAPKRSSDLFQKIMARLTPTNIPSDDTTKIRAITRPQYNWLTYTGWAAAIILGLGLWWTVNQNKALESKVSTVETEKSGLESDIENARTDLVATQHLLNILRDKNIISVPLDGQGNFANTYANVYWDKKDDSIYLDAQGLPEAPEGKVYQVWSLTLDPLTPTSLGTLEDFNTDGNKIFALNNANKSEAFGITLEPAGGSETPTMDQLYTLGVVKNSES